MIGKCGIDRGGDLQQRGVYRAVGGRRSQGVSFTKYFFIRRKSSRKSLLLKSGMFVSGRNPAAKNTYQFLVQKKIRQGEVHVLQHLHNPEGWVSPSAHLFCLERTFECIVEVLQRKHLIEADYQVLVW